MINVRKTMTDTTTTSTETILRQQAITGEAPMPVSVNSDPEVVKEEAKLEAYIVENKGLIMNCLSSLPGPALMLVKGLVKVVLVPLDFVVTLPLTKISQILRDFSKTEPACAPQPPKQDNPDCTPPKIV